jgi:hypothetical protein
VAPSGIATSVPEEIQVAPTKVVVPAKGTAGPEESQEIAVPTLLPTDVPGPDTPTQGMIALARADLALRLGVPGESIVVGSFEEVVWRDASLGCPQPGASYAQVLTPGFAIVLEARGQEYTYHTDRDQVVLLCADEPHAPAVTPDTSRLPIFVEMVQSSESTDSPVRMPPADQGRVGVYVFDSVNRGLLVQHTVQMLPATEVLVGLATAGMPSRPHIPSALYQLPSSPDAPLSVIGIDADSGALTLEYADQIFELCPGDSRAFKEKGAQELGAVEITTITNHGRLAAIGVLPAVPSNR